MFADYWAVSEDELGRMTGGGDAAVEVIAKLMETADDDPDRISADLDKDCDVLDIVLIGAPPVGRPRTSVDDAVMGTAEVPGGFDGGYLATSDPAATKAIAARLATVDLAERLRAYDDEAMGRDDVYAPYDPADRGTMEEVLTGHLATLREFYRRAAEADRGVVVFII